MQSGQLNSFASSSSKLRTWLPQQPTPKMSLAAPKGGAKARGKSPGPGGRSPRVGRKKKKNGPLPLGEQLAAGLKGSQVKPLALKVSHPPVLVLVFSSNECDGPATRFLCRARSCCLVWARKHTHDHTHARTRTHTRSNYGLVLFFLKRLFD